MQRGLLSHTCCCGHEVYRQHIVLLDADNILLSINPFSEETAHTTFVEGYIIITDVTFEHECKDFVNELQQTLTVQPHLTLTHALRENSVYNRHCASTAKPCSVYSLQPISWTSMRPTSIDLLHIKKII